MRLVVEPSSGKLQVCAAGCQPTRWLNFLNHRLSVEVEFEIGAIRVDNVHLTCGWHAKGSHALVMACDVNRHGFTDSDIDGPTKSLHIWRGIRVLPGDIWCDSCDVLFDSLAFLHGHVVCLSVHELR